MLTTVATEPQTIDLTALKFRRLWADGTPQQGWQQAEACYAQNAAVVLAIARRIAEREQYACGVISVGGWKVEYEYATD